MKLNPNLPVELAVNLPNQTKPFVITGDYETVLPYAEQLQAHDARTGRTSHVETNIGHSAIEAPKQAVMGYIGRVGTNMKAVMLDKWYRTNLYEQAINQKRQAKKEERLVKTAVQLGLISLDDATCKRHRHAVDMLK